MAFDYKIVGLTVQNSTGGTAYTGANVTASLNWALSHANTTTWVPAGTYYLTAHVYFANGTTLYGDGDSTLFTTAWPWTWRGSPDGNYLYINGTSNVTMRSFKCTGYATIYCYGPANVTCGNWSFTDVHVTQNGKYGEAGFWVRVAIGGIIDGITYDHCSVHDTCIWGFLLHGFEPATYPGTSLIKHVTYTDCEASRCGIPVEGNGATYVPSQNLANFWGPGFDLVEVTTVQDITCTRCIANDNWCSGFHVEYGAKPVRVQMIDCEAYGNGHMYHYAGAVFINGVLNFNTGANIVTPATKINYGFGFRIHPWNLGWPGNTDTGLDGNGNERPHAGGCILIRCRGDNWNGTTGNYQGMSSITAGGDYGGAPRTLANGTVQTHTQITTWDMKMWVNSVNGSADTGSWIPAGPPTVDSDIVLCMAASQKNLLINTFYHSRHPNSWINIYTGTLTYSTPPTPPSQTDVLGRIYVVPSGPITTVLKSSQPGAVIIAANGLVFGAGGGIDCTNISVIEVNGNLDTSAGSVINGNEVWLLDYGTVKMASGHKLNSVVSRGTQTLQSNITIKNVYAYDSAMAGGFSIIHERPTNVFTGIDRAKARDSISVPTCGLIDAWLRDVGGIL